MLTKMDPRRYLMFQKEHVFTYTVHTAVPFFPLFYRKKNTFNKIEQAGNRWNNVRRIIKNANQSSL